jgi:hypothetical protein
MEKLHNLLEEINDSNWVDFVNAETAVLLLTLTDCPHCRQWVDDLNDFLEKDSEWNHVRFGKIVLDGEDVDDFKHSNEWLDLIDGVPFTVFYQQGVPKNSFHGSGVKRLTRRLERLSKEEEEKES